MLVVGLVDLFIVIRLWKKSREGKPGPIAVSMARRCSLAKRLEELGCGERPVVNVVVAAVLFVGWYVDVGLAGV